MSDVILNVTPGTTFHPSSVVDDAKLNLAAKPIVTLPEGAGVGPEHLDMEAVIDEIGEAVRGINYITRPGFWPQDWKTPAGITTVADVLTENAYDWYALSTGGAILYARTEDGPNDEVLFSAQLVGATGVTATDFKVWIPAGVTSQLRGETLTFSVWIRNLTNAAMFVTPRLECCAQLDEPTTAELSDEGDPQSMAMGNWTRMVFTFDASVIAEMRNGAFLGFRTTALNGSLKSCHVSQAQLEVSSVVTPYKRPQHPALPRAVEGLPPLFGLDAADKIAGGFVAMYLNGTGKPRYLGAPPPSFIKPVLGWNPAGYPEWIALGENKVVFSYTGSIQYVQVPANAGNVTVHAWGAGGADDAPGSNPKISGGVGGYTWGTFPVTPGNWLAIVVGQGVHNKVGRTYGFGGAGQGAAHQHNGGGATMLFTGHTDVTATDDARLLLAAGGGGAGGQSGGGSNASQGGNGNDAASAGGQSTFQGIDATGGISSGNGGGGGGYRGGSGLGLGGKGGTGYLHSSKTAGAIQSSARPSLVVPGSTTENYQEEVGKPGKHGLLVLIFDGGAGALDITTTALANGTVATLYSQTLGATGGDGGYVWTVSSGSLPGGLSLSAGGTLSGTPTTAGSYTFTIMVTDSGSHTDTKVFTVTIV